MVWQTEAVSLSDEQAAKNLGVDKSTVYQIAISSLLQALSINSHTKACQKLTSPVQLLVLHLALEKPGVLLGEIQTELVSVLMLDVDIFQQSTDFSMQVDSQDKSFVMLLYREMNF